MAASLSVLLLELLDWSYYVRVVMLITKNSWTEIECDLMRMCTCKDMHVSEVNLGILYCCI